MEDGYRYLIPLIIFNNVMDDLDGILADKLHIRSRFGADLDNVCDAVAHGVLVLAVGAHFSGLVLGGEYDRCDFGHSSCNIQDQSGCGTWRRFPDQ